MTQLGSFLTGVSLFALFVWKPIWTMATYRSAEELLGYFIVVMMLLFGVFLVIGDYHRFRPKTFVPQFVAGAIVSFAWWQGRVEIALAGFLLFGAVWIALRRV